MHTLLKPPGETETTGNGFLVTTILLEYLKPHEVVKRHNERVVEQFEGRKIRRTFKNYERKIFIRSGCIHTGKFYIERVGLNVKFKKLDK